MLSTRNRLFRLTLTLAGTLCFFCLVLPALNRSVAILGKMAGDLAENGIDPTRYYYTDVEQVKEGERYLSGVLGEQ